MARSKRSQRPRANPPSLPLGREIPTDTGTVRLDQETDGSVLVTLNGMPSSMIHPDAQVLSFEYMRWIFSAIRALHPQSSAEEGRLAIAHLGGGAAALPRALADAYPQSTNSVVEIDGALLDLVRTWFDLPRSPRISLRADDALVALDGWREDRFDLVIRDVFAGGTIPRAFQDLTAATSVRRVLRPGGFYFANSVMRPASSVISDELATLSRVFEHVSLIAEPSALKKRRTANCILIGSDDELPPEVERAIRSDAVSVRLMPNAEVQRMIRHGHVLCREAVSSAADEPAERSGPYRFG
ncbi:spermidine synthase [Helcobacillus massiliensis]|uniref:spermidine synthase n=1 Tax=Helcobacillus massiliensis TaxID=521392 RepID=UPI002554691E|nr:fused MFS/spermidine synthase [Helcobacillus massiliensis]MDK7742489.1 fused MFS/spermidine synthase [Helcobacillus massiliensis]WOO93346.1 fused MFS/spermidine synthase [Helcobacillus massiliensis]